MRTSRNIARRALDEALGGVYSFRTQIAFPDIDDRRFWEGLPDEARRALIRTGDDLLSDEQAIPQILLSDYTEFSRNGNRVNFETKYFRRRTMLTGLVLAMCASNDGKYLDKILDLFYAISGETTWCLPAHNSYIRDTAPLAIPDESRPVVDLFAAETAEILGLAEQLLRPRLEAVSAEIGAFIDRELRRRILEPYLHTHFWWMGNGEEALCNWTPWITQNVLLALFTRREGSVTAKELGRVLEQAAFSADEFLRDYGDDGCCCEGAFYYGHAGLCLFGCYEVMDRITEGRMRRVYDKDIVKNVASYIVKMYVGGGYYINYSDASPFAGRRDARDFLFGKAVGDESYMSFAAADFMSQSIDERLINDEQNLYYHLLQLVSWREMESFTPAPFRPADAYFESAGLMIARDAHWTLAVKAGDNGDSHNHNDVGSVTLYLRERPFLIDLGVETYTAKTFSDRRYEIWTMQSAYHNTMNFRGTESGALIMQQVGKERAARDVECFNDGAVASLKMEMAAVYGDPRVKRCARTVTLKKGAEGAGGRVIISDETETEGGLRGVLCFMTCERPSIKKESDGVFAIDVGGLGVLRASGIANAVIEVCPITDERLGAAWRNDCYRIMLEMAGDIAEVTVSEEIQTLL